MAPTQHELYYMKDGVSFLVENTLFRVPRYMLENTSPVFSAMLSDVRADADPIALPRVTSADFVCLLSFLYPLIPQVNAVPRLWEVEQWTAILRLATMWQMAEIRTVAMQILSQSRCPFTKITLGREYGHSPWIKEGFTMLCLRPEALTASEAVQLTKDDVVACAAAREEVRLRFPPGDRRSAGWVDHSRRIHSKSINAESDPLPNNRVVRQIVNRAFGLEEEDEDETNMSKPESDKCNWFPLDIKAPQILWLIKSHNDGGERSTSSITNIREVSDAAYKKIKALSASASILTVAGIQTHWIRDTLPKDILKYDRVTLLSCSAVALSVGFLILIPFALT
ncbi:hypothetical protein JB92DRAFT_3127466 [Gautieria morchelliformis]|nr:hypothetical protein JB92DRAFT_3127466 [Gautieria morchelliformis]